MQGLTGAPGPLPTALLVLLLVAGCAGPPQPDAGTAKRSGPGRADTGGEPAAGLAETLGGLADDALAAGDLAAAEDRYGRLLAYDPGSVRALVGLGRTALAQGESEAARARFERALALDPTAVEAHLGLADLAGGDPAAQRAHLERALVQMPTHPVLHARLAALTGSSTRTPRDLDEAIEAANRHPYDPRSLAEVGRRLADAGRVDEAVPVLEAVLGLADLDARAADRAIALLPTLSERWSERRIVPVQVFLDAPLRQQDGWRFRQRQLWLEISEALDPLLHARFVVSGFAPFDDAPAGASLDARLVALGLRSDDLAPGLFAGFTAEPTPRRAGARRGIAEYLGRRLFVRDARGEDTLRVLAHEVLHVYGAVHVAEDLDSLMNPSGDSHRVDALNARIVRSLATRSFGPGGVERNVLPHVDLRQVTQAYTRALQVNLRFRELGLSELLGDATVVGPGAYRQAQRVTRLDPHLADVSRFAARLFWASGRRVQAVSVLELSASLYGRQTAEGRATWAQAQVLRERLKAELGVE